MTGSNVVNDTLNVINKNSRQRIDIIIFTKYPDNHVLNYKECQLQPDRISHWDFTKLCIRNRGANILCRRIFLLFWERMYASEKKRKMVEASGFYDARWLDCDGCILVDLQD